MSDSPEPHFANVDIDSYREHFKPGDHTLVDVREPEEWVSGHLPGAIHIPLNDLPDRLSEIPGDKPVVLVCAVGSRSFHGSQFLLESGFMEVYNLSDGTMGWMRKGLPLER
jgi:rhodanese-related sulfurtransferase